MDNLGIIKALTDSGVVAVIRLSEGKHLLDLCAALNGGGITGLEITMTTPGTLQAIKEVSEHLGSRAAVGAGTILDAETGRMAILSGARFLVSPVLNVELARLCKRYSVPYICGAFSPTEVITAWETGVDVVKVFPITRMGPFYIKDLLGSFPGLKLAPTGGIDISNLGQYLQAGASFVGVGRALVNETYVSEQKWGALRSLAQEYIQAAETAREKR